jgi:hypothetical protein
VLDIPSSAPIIGDLTADDELMHPATADRSFNESMMFNFFDHSQRLGGFVRIGSRVNERHAEVTLCIFMPAGDVLMQWAKPAIDTNTRFHAAGMSFRVHEPLRRLEVAYTGPAVRIADPLQTRNSGRALRENPTVLVVLQLEVTNTGPMIGSASGNSRASVIFLDGVGITNSRSPRAARSKPAPRAGTFPCTAPVIIPGDAASGRASSVTGRSGSRSIRTSRLSAAKHGLTLWRRRT